MTFSLPSPLSLLKLPNIPPTVTNFGEKKKKQREFAVHACNESKFDWPMKDMSINQKKVGGRNLEEEFGQALFFVSPTPHYVPRETKIEPDRRINCPLIALAKRNRNILQYINVSKCLYFVR